MTLEQLRIFVAVAEQEHMTRAAAALHLTQSATSAAVAALEARYATKLFDRVGRNIKLTEAGRLFLIEARAVLARAAAAETVLADLAGLKRGSLSIAASQTVGNYWLPPLLHRYRERHSGIALDLTIGNTEQAALRVREGLADVGYVEGEIDDPALSVSPVAEDELVLVVGASHPWTKLASIKPALLKETTWIAREPGSGTRKVLEASLAGFGLASEDIDIGLALPSNESVRSAVAAGAGATIISKLVIANLLKSGGLVALDLPLPSRRFFSVRHKERYVTQAERELERLIGD
ncbi:LysR family transcriptional regulator [Afipia sp. TerB]